MSRDLDAVLTAIDGALGDDELPDAMRWSPDPAQVTDAGAPYTDDGWPLLPELRELRLPRQQGRGPVTGASLLGIMGTAVANAAEVEQARARLVLVFGTEHEAAEAFREAVRHVTEGLAPLWEQVRRACDEAARSMLALYEQGREAGLLPDAGPTDPKARALWARQHRSTGPQVPRAQAARRPRRHA